ncbi:MAG: GxxExxY protein [Bacillota bacterium]
MGELLHSEITERVIGAAFEVHRELGPGFLEAIYEKALVQELALRGVRCERQVRIPIAYKRVRVGTHVLDLVVENLIVVELKAQAELAEINTAIVLSYLAAARRRVALLLNFGKTQLEFRRVVR